MVRVNDEVAAVLQEYADLVAITGGDAFRVWTYEKASRSVGGFPDDISQLDERGLRLIPNVGASIAAKIGEYLRTGGDRSAGGAARQSPGRGPAAHHDPGARAEKAMVLYEELEAGLPGARIVASGSLDEYAIAGLVARGAPIDAYGVGTKMGVSADAPYRDGV